MRTKIIDFLMLTLITTGLIVLMFIVLTIKNVPEASIQRIMTEVVRNTILSAILSSSVLVCWPSRLSLIFVGTFWCVYFVDLDHWPEAIANSIGVDGIIVSRTMVHSIVMQTLLIIVIFSALWAFSFFKKNSGDLRISIFLSAIIAEMAVAANFLIDWKFGWDAHIFWLLPNLVSHVKLPPIMFYLWSFALFFFGLFISATTKTLYLIYEYVKKKIMGPS